MDKKEKKGFQMPKVKDLTKVGRTVGGVFVGYTAGNVGTSMLNKVVDKIIPNFSGRKFAAPLLVILLAGFAHTQVKSADLKAVALGAGVSAARNMVVAAKETFADKLPDPVHNGLDMALGNAGVGSPSYNWDFNPSLLGLGNQMPGFNPQEEMIETASQLDVSSL